jgi:hypothetical protein
MKRTKADFLLEQLCADLGFCLRPEDREKLSNSLPHSADEFTDAVRLAEGFDPSFADKHLRRQIHDRVTKYFINAESGDIS